MSVTMTVMVCVLLSAVPGNERLLIDYEDRVLELLAGHGGRVLRRVRAIDPRSAPYEMQLIEFPSEAAFEGFMSDPARAAMSGLRDRAVAATEGCAWRSCQRIPDGCGVSRHLPHAERAGPAEAGHPGPGNGAPAYLDIGGEESRDDGHVEERSSWTVRSPGRGSLSLVFTKPNFSYSVMAGRFSSPVETRRRRRWPARLISSRTR